MAFSLGNPSYTIDDVLAVTNEAAIASHYLGIKSIPSRINSPLRKDNNPSMGIYSPNGTEVNYIDFATKEGGRIFTLLSKMWGKSIPEVYESIIRDFRTNNNDNRILVKFNSIKCYKRSNIDLKCKVRDWMPHDIKYWESFGVTLEWLKWADVYPISHKIIVKNGETFAFGADKYAYVFVEHKEGITTLKIYQPFNTNGYKWSNTHDKSVLSLWTKIPESGDKVCICSSVKDALCLSANMHIPALAIQGEGYPISDTAIKELKRRFTNIYIILDNDDVGLKDALELSKKTGFTNIVIPKFEGGKDISDYYKTQGKNNFINTFNTLLK